MIGDSGFVCFSQMRARLFLLLQMNNTATRGDFRNRATDASKRRDFSVSTCVDIYELFRRL